MRSIRMMIGGDAELKESPIVRGFVELRKV